MNLIYITDTQWRGTSPRSRLDNLPATQILKLRETLRLARAHRAAAILHGGDLFDRPDTAPAVVLEYMQVIREEAPCPILAIAGNHDIFGYNPSTLPQTMLGLMNGAGLVHVIQPGHPRLLEQNGLTVQVTGQPFHAELDRRDPMLDYIVHPADDPCDALHRRQSGTDFAIHLTHGMLLEKPFLDGVAHTLLSDVYSPAVTLADVTFGAHYHPGWSRIYTDRHGMTWCNPGALSRMTNDVSDMTRPIQAVLVTLEKGHTPRLEFIPLESARPADEVIDRTIPAAELAREQAQQDVLNGLGDTSRLQVVAVEAMLNEIAGSTGVAPEVREEALKRLAIAQAEAARREAAA